MRSFNALFLVLIMLFSAAPAMATGTTAVIGGADGPTAITVAELPPVHTQMTVTDMDEKALIDLVKTTVTADLSPEELAMAESLLTSICELVEMYRLDMTMQNNGLFYTISLADDTFFSFDIAVEESKLTFGVMADGTGALMIHPSLRYDHLPPLSNGCVMVSSYSPFSTSDTTHEKGLSMQMPLVEKSTEFDGYREIMGFTS